MTTSPDVRRFYNIRVTSHGERPWTCAVLSTEERSLAREVAGLLRKAGFTDISLTEFREDRKLTWKHLKVK